MCIIFGIPRVEYPSHDNL